jgi:hypothetical protein
MGSGSSTESGAHCPDATRMECSRCYDSSFGRCDHCRSRFCTTHFQAHVQTCPVAQQYSQRVIKCIPECCYCDDDAKGRCGGCSNEVCNSCFVRSHKYYTIYR